MGIKLVTGGGGFLGRRIVELLLEQGHTVRFCARGTYPEVEALGAEGISADLTDASALPALFNGGVDAVFHVAAKAGIWGKEEDFRAINVVGTQNILNAAIAANCPTFIYTSTPSVCGYEKEAEGIAFAPYPKKWEGVYGKTKAEAEQFVLAANGKQLPNGDLLSTVSLRPHLIIGPRDMNLMPKVVARAKAGKLKIVGPGDNVVDITFVDNAAWAHLDAHDALLSGNLACAGKAYFISNDEPVQLWTWINEFLSELDVPPVTSKISLGLATAVGALMEGAWTVFPLSGEPKMTRFMAAAFARSHWYDITPAREDFGYKVRVSLKEGTQATTKWFKESGLV